MRKILCPTDFSDIAQNAIAYAAKLSQAIGARLVLYNVQSMYELEPQELVRGKGLKIEAAQERLEAQSLEISNVFRISCYAEVQPSSMTLARAISEKAKDFDLIVMGTNGADDIVQFLTGSNAYRAAVKSNVPVLLIPEGCGYTEIRRTVYAFDYLRARKLPMAQLLPLIELLKCELSVLQVMEEAYSREAEDELKEIQYIAQHLHAENIKLNFDTIRSYEIAESIHSYILRNQPDILALCTFQRNLIQNLFHNSVIKNISGVASYPVLVFHH